MSDKQPVAKKNSKIWLYLPAVLILVGVVAFTMFYQFGGNKGGSVELRPGDTVVVAQGQAIYQANCASCHGVNLEGQANWQSLNSDGKMPAPPHDQSGHTWHHANGLLFDMTKFGAAKIIGDDYKSDMLAFGNVLTDEEIIAVLSYIKSTWPLGVQRSHDQINREAIKNEANP